MYSIPYTRASATKLTQKLALGGSLLLSLKYKVEQECKSEFEDSKLSSNINQNLTIKKAVSNVYKDEINLEIDILAKQFLLSQNDGRHCYQSKSKSILSSLMTLKPNLTLMYRVSTI